MSDKMTRIRLPGLQHGRGWLEWGEKTRQEMIHEYKTQAYRDRDAAIRIIEADARDFEIDVVRGPIVQHFIRKALP